MDSLIRMDFVQRLLKFVRGRSFEGEDALIFATSSTKRQKKKVTFDADTKITYIPRRSARPPSPKRLESKVRTGRINKGWNAGAKRRGSRGLKNSGNDCYRNAVLQCLLNSSEVVRFLNTIHAKCSKDATTCIVCALKSLAQAYWETKAKPPQGPAEALEVFNITLKATIPASSDMSGDIKAGVQSDPYDFLRYLLDSVHGQQVLEKEGEADSHRPQVNDFFKIEHDIEWTCVDCGAVTTRSEGENIGHGYGVAVDPLKHSANDSLLRLLREREYEIQSTLRCESEQCLATFGGAPFEGKPRVRKRYITRSPEVLVFRLVRFSHHRLAKEFQAFKIRDPLRFEEFIDMGEFTRGDEALLYRLQGVVAHRGTGIRSGHYIAAVREASGRSFCSVNDDVSISREAYEGAVEELQYPRSNGDEFTPYLLFYTKV